MERMTSDVARDLHIQGEAARVLLANIRDIIGDDEDMASVAIEGETDLIEAIASAVDRCEELKSYREALETRIKELKGRLDRFEGQEQRIRAALHVAMGHAGQRKIELPEATISVRPVPPKAEIVDEAAIPSKFWKPQDPKLDKTAVLAALKGNERVPGAVLSNGSETISIRVK